MLMSLLMVSNESLALSGDVIGDEARGLRIRCNATRMTDADKSIGDVRYGKRISCGEVAVAGDDDGVDDAGEVRAHKVRE